MSKVNKRHLLTRTCQWPISEGANINGLPSMGVGANLHYFGFQAFVDLLSGMVYVSNILREVKDMAGGIFFEYGHYNGMLN